MELGGVRKIYMFRGESKIRQMKEKWEGREWEAG